MQDLFSYIVSPELQKKIFFLKFLFLSISAVLAAFLLWALRKTEWLKYYFGQDLVEFKNFRAFEAVEFVKRWERAKKRLRKGWEPEAKLAIIEADQLLDELLKRMGYTGKNLEERLAQLDKKTFPNIDEIWQAHTIRNNIVHDPDYKLSLEKAKEIMKVYEKTFEKLEAL